MIEISVKVSGDDMTLTEHFLVHETISMSHDDPALSKIVSDTIAKFSGVVEDVLVKAKYTW
jgi:hypothetical protein